MEALIAVLPIALIALACPLLMLFLMRGAHGGSGHGVHHASGDPARRLAEIEGELERLRQELAPTAPGGDHETSPGVTDPVCGMSFPAQRSAATTTHGGTVYHFCSESCRSLFEGDPEAFALKAATRGLHG